MLPFPHFLPPIHYSPPMMSRQHNRSTIPTNDPPTKAHPVLSIAMKQQPLNRFPLDKNLDFVLTAQKISQTTS